MDQLWVYDDNGLVKGFLWVDDKQIKKLFVEPVLQSRGIGEKLLEYAVSELDATYLWALEKNTRAIDFYKRHGFMVTDEKMLEEGTTEYLVKLIRTERCKSYPIVNTNKSGLPPSSVVYCVLPKAKEVTRMAKITLEELF